MPMIRNDGQRSRRFAFGAYSVTVEPTHVAYIPNIPELVRQIAADPDMSVIADGTSLAFPVVAKLATPVVVRERAGFRSSRSGPQKLAPTSQRSAASSAVRDKQPKRNKWRRT